MVGYLNLPDTNQQKIWVQTLSPGDEPFGSRCHESLREAGSSGRIIIDSSPALDTRRPGCNVVRSTGALGSSATGQQEEN